MAFISSNPQLLEGQQQPEAPAQQEAISPLMAGVNAGKEAALGLIEPVMTVGSSIVAEPLAGLSGLRTLASGGSSADRDE